MSVIISFVVQKMMGQGISNMLSGRGGEGNLGSMQSMLLGLGSLNGDHELVKQVQQKAEVQDPEQAKQYTQQGVDLLNEQSRSNPQGIQSLLAGFMGGGSGCQQGKGGGGGLGGMIGDVLGDRIFSFE
jgi:hypothetical protein